MRLETPEPKLTPTLVIGLEVVLMQGRSSAHASQDVVNNSQRLIKAGGARRFCEALARRGILTTTTHDHIIRISPPLVIRRKEVDWAIDRIAAVLADQDLGEGR